MNLHPAKSGQAAGNDPQWYRDAVFYELRVKSFMDSNGDGMGDLPGLAEKLDYLQDLGVTALWLLPFYPSPNKDDGYDIADYKDVHPDMGTLDDFRAFLDKAHERGLKVITELVLNHTSDQHAWFQRARRAPAGSAHRNFYVWSDTPDRYRDARIIFRDFEPSNWSWDRVAKAYYWHRFYSHQPDLNFESPDVKKALFEAVDFWLSMGVDGLRLDAVPYLHEEEGTSCENLPATHAFLRDLRRHVDERFPHRMLLAEANQWPEDAAAYFGRGDECHMGFHFPVMPRIFMSIHMEDRFPIVDIVSQTPAVPEGCQWALFLRNHDELTLEMVTDEERDYMYGAYAGDPSSRINLGIRRRLAPLLQNDRRKIELVTALLCSLPGTPVLYYGDEIGMGDNIFLGDRNGVRTPMQWSADRNAGFSRANPQRLVLPVIIDPEYHYESLNVEAQQNNPSSLLWWTKRLLALRRRLRAFGRGSIEFLHPENARVLAFLRRHEDELLLVVANLSRHVQYVELDLSCHKGRLPVELFGRTRFPEVGDLPYLLTLGGHEFYWFALERPREAPEQGRVAVARLPMLEVDGSWETVVEGKEPGLLDEALLHHLEGCHWFESAGRQASGLSIIAAPRVGEGTAAVRLLLFKVSYLDGEPLSYALPLSFASGEKARFVQAEKPRAVVAALRVRSGDRTEEGVLFEALADAETCRTVLEAIVRGTKIRAPWGELSGAPCPEEVASASEAESLEPRLYRSDASSGAVVFADRMFLKFCHRLPEGVSPELELGRFFSRVGECSFVAPLEGALECRLGRGEWRTLATLHDHVPNEGTAWKFTREELGRYFERVLAAHRDRPQRSPAVNAPWLLADVEPAPQVRDAVGAYLGAAQLLGRRIAGLHAILSSEKDDPALAPEPYSPFDQRSTYQSMRNLAGRVLRELRGALHKLSARDAELARQVLGRERQIFERFEPLLARRLTALRARIHGDLRLSKVLFTGKDFVFVDFDGDRSRPLAERRRKRSPLRDVATMLTSLEQAVQRTLHDRTVVREGDRELAEAWADLWLTWSAAALVRGYVGASASALVPQDRSELALLLDAFAFNKALAEVSRELSRPEGRPFLALRILLKKLGS